MKILIVDDDKLILTVLSSKLKTKGYEIISADNVIDALGILQDQNINFIISDIMMSGLSGLSLLSVLKEFHFHKIPLIFISSLDQTNLISKSLGLGADDFIVKPINFGHLFLKIEQLTNSKDKN
ncbi:MAG: hypothetical protein A3F72_02660 [Bacteroidetes bacterium RIFCSPLOWO2_12_FULL_35_15]|nr:MAG: hypothetical protein A3F72_02660 [Bacteroidetes bacterium RIFCSPLOWO2_12_FULL_35_15]